MRDPTALAPSYEAAVTGIGAVTPQGIGVGALAAGIAAGVRGTRIRAEPKGSALPPALARRMDLTSRLAACCALDAAAAAGLGTVAPEDVGVSFGTTYGDLEGVLRFLDRVDVKGPHLAPPADFPNLVVGASAGHLCLAGGWRGPQSSACGPDVAGQQAIAWALDRLADGDAAAMVVVAGDVLSAVREAHPTSDGPPGEGMAALVLEAPGSARRRGAPVLARIAVAGAGDDAGSPGLDLGDPWGSVPSDGVLRAVVAVLMASGRLPFAAPDGAPVLVLRPRRPWGATLRVRGA